MSEVDSGWDDSPISHGGPTAASQALAARPPTAAEIAAEEEGPAPPIALRADLPPDSRDPDGEDVFTQDALDDLDDPPRGVLANVCGVKFNPGGKTYDHDAGDASYARGERVVVESDRGPIVGTVAMPSLRRHVGGEPLRRVLRRAEPRDLEAADKAAKLGAEHLKWARERVREKRMPIKVFRVDVAPGGGKATFYFSSEDRIDFRDLVRDLGAKLHVRVEMRQVGARDEAKMVGGIGSCGRELCCTTFLPRFDPVSIKMAKDQGLVLNPSKVSGQCGRLKCCLVYEQAVYSEMRKGLPKLGKRVSTPGGEGRVVEVDVLRRRIRVSFGPGEFEVFPADVVAPVIMQPPPPAAGGPRRLPVVDPSQGSSPGPARGSQGAVAEVPGAAAAAAEIPGLPPSDTGASDLTDSPDEPDDDVPDEPPPPPEPTSDATDAGMPEEDPFADEEPPP